MRIAFEDMGTKYVVLPAREVRRSNGSGEGALECVPPREVRWILESAFRREPALLSRLDQALRGASLCTSSERFWTPGALVDPRLEGVVRAFGVDGGVGAPAGGSGLASLCMLRHARGERPDEVEPQTPELRRIVAALARLGRADVVYRGEAYSFIVASSRGRITPASDQHETTSEAQLFAVLRALLAEPTTPPPRKEVLTELLTAADAQRAKTGATTLLLLRRIRAHVRPVADELPAITPSQLRREAHWIEIVTLDGSGNAVAGVRVEVELSDRSRNVLKTNDEGFARLERVAAGEVTVGLPRRRRAP